MSAAFVTGPSAALRARVPTVAVSSRAAPAMSLRANIARAAATIPAALLAAPALAEGTGESFGVDSPLLLLPLVVRRPFVAMTTLAAVLRRFTLSTSRVLTCVCDSLVYLSGPREQGIPVVFLFLFLQFDGSQDKSDFFGAKDDRRK
jgi:hypothetical protein